MYFIYLHFFNQYRYHCDHILWGRGGWLLALFSRFNAMCIIINCLFLFGGGGGGGGGG